MFKLKFIVLALAILIPSYAFSGDLGTLRITLIEDGANVYDGVEKEWLEASANMPLKEDDSVWVPEEGRMELHVRGGAVVRLDGRTALDVLDLEEESVRFYLDEGRLYVNSSLEGHTRVVVETPISSVDIPEGSIVMLSVSESKAARISVLKGHADVESSLGTTRVNAGSTLRAGEDLHAEIFPVGDPNAWEKWNRQRDKDITGPFESARYLPDELDEYAYDFDGNGTWVHVKEYGYVWRPAISISIGWSPYRHGRWAWVAGDYVWISYERWGWVPYHYGRWAYVSRIGWCWLPPRHRQVYWGPGYVGWVHTPTYVAWVPLAPGEIYYGYGYYGPRSVNIINININKTVINRHYRNVYAKNAVTVIHRDTFISGRKVDFRLKQNPFVHERPSIGPPKIKPDRHRDALIVLKGYDEKRFRERIERRERDIKQRRWNAERRGTPVVRREIERERASSKIERTRPTITDTKWKEQRRLDAKEIPAARRDRWQESPRANTAKPERQKTQKELKRPELKESPLLKRETARGEPSPTRIERRAAEKPRNEWLRTDIKESRPPEPPARERPTGRIESRKSDLLKGTREQRPAPEARRPSVIEPRASDRWQSRASSPQTIEKRQPKASVPQVSEKREPRIPAPQVIERQQPRASAPQAIEKRKPMTPAPQAIEKRQPRVVDPSSSELRETRRVPQNNGRPQQAERGRANSRATDKEYNEMFKDSGGMKSSTPGVRGRGW